MKVTFGGDRVVYALKLRVRGIWEPTTMTAASAPSRATRSRSAAWSRSGVDPINYQQWSIR